MSKEKQVALNYDKMVNICKNVFEQKTKDYGTSWRILRLPSITDQIMIKTQRIRSIEDLKTQCVPDDIFGELIGIVNYGVIGLIQASLNKNTPITLNYQILSPRYDAIIQEASLLCNNKNHDYQNAWKEMRFSSMTDIILMKLLRIKSIEDNNGKTLISEGISANYLDIINYAIFSAIRYDQKSLR